MKKIELIFPGLGYNDVNQAIIYIYDQSNTLLIQEKTYNGRLSVCLNSNKFYHILIESKYEKEKYSFFLNRNNEYVFPLSSSYICTNRAITFLLTDSNYANLPIEKGMIYLWQKQLCCRLQQQKMVAYRTRSRRTSMKPSLLSGKVPGSRRWSRVTSIGFHMFCTIWLPG